MIQSSLRVIAILYFHFLRRSSLICVVTFGIATNSVLAADLSSGRGLTDPTLSFGISGVSDWSTQSPFIDITHTMRPWIGNTREKWGAMSHEQLRDGGYLDDHGWPTKTPDGMDSVTTIWAWGGSKRGSVAAEPRTGIYVMTYEGEGRIRLSLGAKVLSAKQGRFVFANPYGGTMSLNILSTDPKGTGNYIRNISIIPKKYTALALTGELFNPDWLAVVEDARELRFMGWMKTNNSTLSEWDDRPQVGDATWAVNGVPLEVMVQLANQTGTDPWFNMPARATDDFIRKFATFVRDNLDPKLKAHVEYSNENWNWAFQQTKWLDARAKEVWGEKGNNIDFYAKRATETALIWDKVFGEQAETRVENIVATQTANPWIANRLLTAPIWAGYEPDTYVDPSSVFDSLAIANYFGGSDVSNPDLRTALIAAISDPEIDANAYLVNNLLDPNIRWSLPYTMDKWNENMAIADKYGLDLIAYEGGQHVHHSFAVAGLTDDDLAVLTGFLADFVRSPEMAELYGQLWDIWAKMSDGPFMQFGDVGVPSKYGSWGLLSSLGDTNPRAELL